MRTISEPGRRRGRLWTRFDHSSSIKRSFVNRGLSRVQREAECKAALAAAGEGRQHSTREIENRPGFWRVSAGKKSRSLNEGTSVGDSGKRAPPSRRFDPSSRVSEDGTVILSPSRTRDEQRKAFFLLLEFEGETDSLPLFLRMRKEESCCLFRREKGAITISLLSSSGARRGRCERFPFVEVNTRGQRIQKLGWISIMYRYVRKCCSSIIL